MENNATKLLLKPLGLVLLLATITLVTLQISWDSSPVVGTAADPLSRLKDEAREEEENREEMKKARDEYFFQMLRDPATNSIPRDIRAKELQKARTLPTMRQLKARQKAKNPAAKLPPEFSWQLAGPPATGGRTRALGVDRRDSDIIIAGGVSGGIWKSSDGGDSWDLKTPDAENLSVTYVSQDPTNPDTWYYVAGEFTGNSAGALGATYYGTGIFKSTDNGNTWALIPGTGDSDTIFNSKFDFISRIVVSPTTGSVFTSSNGVGISRSTDGNDFSEIVLGGLGFHLYSTVDVASDGTLVAVLSSLDASSNPVENDPGIFISENDGDLWVEVTPDSFPPEHARSVATFAPSNPDILYILTQKAGEDSTNQGLSFHKIDLSPGVTDPAAEDRSANLPGFGEPVGNMELQGGYNMVVAVKPDDPDFVMVGGTNLFRSTDGFATTPSGGYDNDNTAQKNQFWIGGYAKGNNISQYPNQHADQHIVAFDPANPNRMFAGTDGGVHVTQNVGASSVSWTDKNEGYIVTQFYAAAIPPDPDDPRLMGGTQDNGTPIFSLTEISPDSTFDISSGDGGLSFFSENFVFVSTQQGRVLRWANDFSALSYVNPTEVDRDALLFIHAYIVDPNNENIMYYPDLDHMWRNTSLDQIPNDNPSSGATQGWEELPTVDVPSGYTITALDISRAPAGVLYYAGFSNNGPPVIKRLDNASSSTTPVDIPLPNNPALAGAYIHNIAVNPVNANEALVVLSNYGVPSIYHTQDGGSTWTDIEGNLSGPNGPSVRSAAIIPADDGPLFMLGTSIGIYATQNLNGADTEWGQEAENELGFSVVEAIASRFTDGDVAAGTHGRGMFYASCAGCGGPFITTDPNSGEVGDQITIRANDFTFNTDPSQIEVRIGNAEAEIASVDTARLEVIVPRNTLEPTAESNSVNVRVTNDGQPFFSSFNIIPPKSFTIAQNFPNPFSSTTSIPLDISQSSKVTVTVYDIMGREVRQPLRDEDFNPGAYNTPVDFTGLASGVYIYRVVAEPNGPGDTFTESKKMTFIK